jgi:hypothetical protein
LGMILSGIGMILPNPSPNYWSQIVDFRVCITLTSLSRPCYLYIGNRRKSFSASNREKFGVLVLGFDYPENPKIARLHALQSINPQYR